MTIDEMTYDHIKACSLRCPIKLPKKIGRVDAASGDWLACTAKSEEVRRYTRFAKADLRDRELRGGSYPGDHGHVVIGGKKFTLYNCTPIALIRDDFAQWISANWQSVITEDGQEKEPDKPERQEDVELVSINRLALTAKERAKEFKYPTDLLPEDAWNTPYEINRQLVRYKAEIERDSNAGNFYVITRLNALLLAALSQHKQRNYSEAIDCFVGVAALALKGAEFETREHAIINDPSATEDSSQKG